MTKAEVENRLMNEIHYLPIEIIEEMLRWALVIKKIALPESIALPNHIDKRDMIEELINNPLKVYDSKLLSRDEIYSRQEQPRKKITVHTFHGDGLKPGINLNNSSDLQDVLDEDRIA